MNKAAMAYLRIPALLLPFAALVWVRCAQPARGFLNLSESVAYTGKESCRSCHEKIYDSYLHTGMGQSMYRPSRDRIVERMGEVVVDKQRNFSYRAFWAGDSMYIEEFRVGKSDTLYYRRERVDYVVGSGHQTRSYLMEREGALFEMPITWYVEKGIWDLSPGYEVRNSRFSREIGVECLACHTGYIEPEPGTRNRYRSVSLGIDCEKCHGPGEEHIRRIEAGQLIDVGEETDYSIVNPAKLSLDLQFDVCQQCHLQGVQVYRPGKSPLSFRPGMALSQAFDVFLPLSADPEAFGIASHAERLRQSRCFIASEGRLTCTTCHDPHTAVRLSGPEVFIRQCQSCHGGGLLPSCGADPARQQAMNGNCIGCHMPAGGTSDIPHVRFHDHKIRIPAEQPPAQASPSLTLHCATCAQPDAEAQAEALLRYFEEQHADSALLKQAQQISPPTDAKTWAKIHFYAGDYLKALARQEEALAQSPGDPFQLFFKGQILEALQRHEEAYAAYRKVLEQLPANPDAAIKAGSSLLRARAGDPRALAEAEGYFRQASAAQPLDPQAWANLGFVSLNSRRWPDAAQQLRRALALDPDHPQALENMAYLCLAQLRHEDARQYAEKLASVAPRHPGLERLRAALSAAVPAARNGS